ncbi:MAG: hypothetical protein QM758_26175 [Armatimonas sp.]
MDNRYEMLPFKYLILYCPKVAYWFLELFLGILVMPWIGRLLTMGLAVVAPRQWNESTVPPHSKIGGITLGLILYGVSFFVSAFVAAFYFSRLPSVLSFSLWFFHFNILGKVLWSIARMRSWWILEPGCPLRASIDSLAGDAGIELGRVRLRDSSIVKPRVFLDGAIELTNCFFKELNEKEQKCLIAACLYERQDNAAFKRGAKCISLFAGYFIFVMSVIKIYGHLFPQSELAPAPLVSIFFYCISQCYSWKPYSIGALKYSLVMTKDMDSLDSAMAKLDGLNRWRYMPEIIKWWKTGTEGGNPGGAPTL